MLESLNSLDTFLFLTINRMNAPWLDHVMLVVSYNRYIFLSAILALSLYGIKLYKKWYLMAFFCCLISFALSDRISSGVFKPYFKRLRPCHHSQLATKVNLAEKKCWGGKYGFVSSHASNSFSIASFFWLLFRRRGTWFYLLFSYAGIISYSRVYLARHYPGDVLIGALLGLLCGHIGYSLFIWTKKHVQDRYG